MEQVDLHGGHEGDAGRLDDGKLGDVSGGVSDIPDWLLAKLKASGATTDELAAALKLAGLPANLPEGFVDPKDGLMARYEAIIAAANAAAGAASDTLGAAASGQ